MFLLRRLIRVFRFVLREIQYTKYSYIKEQRILLKIGNNNVVYVLLRDNEETGKDALKTNINSLILNWDIGKNIDVLIFKDYL